MKRTKMTKEEMQTKIAQAELDLVGILDELDTVVNAVEDDCDVWDKERPGWLGDLQEAMEKLDEGKAMLNGIDGEETK